MIGPRRQYVPELEQRLLELEEEQRLADHIGNLKEEQRLWAACMRVRARIEELMQGAK